MHFLGLVRLNAWSFYRMVHEDVLFTGLGPGQYELAVIAEALPGVGVVAVSYA